MPDSYSRREGRLDHRWFATIPTFALLIVLSACAPIPNTSKLVAAPDVHSLNARIVLNATPKRIALYGDSLAGQAAPVFSYIIARVVGVPALTSTLDGTAPCDALPNLLEAAKSHILSVAVIDFSGNSLTPCMLGAPVDSPSYFSRYRYNITAATKALVSSGTNVVLAGSPETFRQFLRGGASWEWLNRMLASVARADPTHVRFANAGASVMSDGHFTWSLPCLRDEPCLNQPTSGRNFVRSPDGAHFCPFGRATAQGVVSPCTEYMSGAFRYGTALAVAALQMLPHR